MCGFFCTNLPNIPLNLHDVESRGWATQSFSHSRYTAVQSQLPCYTGKLDFDHYECADYIFSFTGEIYNTPKEYATDTEYMRSRAIRADYSDLNGAWAFVLYNKQTQTITYGVDPVGQVPLFVYAFGGITLSNTLPSMVHQVGAKLDPQTLARWQTAKHYTSRQTQWLGIVQAEPGVVQTVNSLGVTVNSVRVPVRRHNTVENPVTVLEQIQSDYTTVLDSEHIVSGGIDSTVLAHTWCSSDNRGLDHVGKDWVSNTLGRFHQLPVTVHEISEQTWCNAVEQFVQETYTVPYTWSWVGYYLLGYYTQANVLYTGEGADEIFGGYPGYSSGGTPYSSNPEHDELRTAVKNPKLVDQAVFIPVACTGANIALGCHTVEPRNPYLDHRIIYNDHYVPQLNKPDLTNRFLHVFGDSRLQPKQGFGGFPDEFSKSITDQSWPVGPWRLAEKLFSHL